MKSPTTQLFILLSLCLMVFGLIAVQAQQEVNLLANPGFEASFGSNNVGEGWVPWHIGQSAGMRDFENTEPTYEPVAPNNARIRSGANAQQYSSFYATHDGGIYQKVSDITPDTELRFSIYAYVWSSTFDDLDLSEEDGNVKLSVGIDPSGGTDPSADSIVWSIESEQYDAYRQYSIIAVAESSEVTVFVRSNVGEPVSHSYIYLDDAVLSATTDSAQPSETDTVEPVETEEPTDVPTEEPTDEPTDVPTEEPTDVPTEEPTDVPTEEPTDAPTEEPTDEPTAVPPTATLVPTNTLVPPTATPVPTNTSVPVVEDATPTPEDLGDTAEPTSTPANIVPTATSIPDVGGPTTSEDANFPGRLVHKVRRGDTVAKLAALYGSTADQIIKANQLDASALIYMDQGLIIPVRLPNPATETPTSTPVVQATATPEQFGTGGPVTSNRYIVQPDDTLSTIAARYNTTVGALVQLNGIANPNRIFVGQTIAVPVPNVGAPAPAETEQAPQPVIHIVQPGETFYQLSVRYGVSMRRLAEANGITNANLIFVGQRLTIP